MIASCGLRLPYPDARPGTELAGAALRPRLEPHRRGRERPSPSADRCRLTQCRATSPLARKELRRPSRVADPPCSLSTADRVCDGVVRPGGGRGRRGSRARRRRRCGSERTLLEFEQGRNVVQTRSQTAQSKPGAAVLCGADGLGEQSEPAHAAEGDASQIDHQLGRMSVRRSAEGHAGCAGRSPRPPAPPRCPHPGPARWRTRTNTPVRAENPVTTSEQHVPGGDLAMTVPTRALVFRSIC